MNAIPASEAGNVTARAVIVVVALYLALAVGAPWLLNDAPPMAQDVLATQACCSAAPMTVPAKPAKAAPSH